MPQREAFPWRVVALYGPFATAGGAVIGFLMAGFRASPRMLLHGAFIGFTCFFASVFAEFLFHGWLEKHPEAWWRRALVYFVASQIGWPIGLYAGLLIVWQRPVAVTLDRRVWTVVLALGALGTLAGVAAYGYDRLKERLRASIEQLKEKEFADKELQLARELQSRMLPAPEIAADGYRIRGRNFAAHYVAGDFFDVFHYGDGSVGIAVADVAGKGLAASLIMASVKAVLPLLATTRDVGEAMDALNAKLAAELSKREFVALVLAKFDPASGMIAVANAGLPDPYVLRRDGGVEVVEVTGPRLPLGLRPGVAYEQTVVSLAPGDAMLLLSDGFPEATASDGEQLGYERLAEIIRDAGADIDGIVSRVHAATSDVYEDDQTVVLIERTAAEGVMSSIPRLEIAAGNRGSQSARVSDSQS